MPDATLAETLGSAVIAEWDASIAGLMFTDVAKTTPVSDGSLMEAVESTALGGSHDLTELTIKPTYRADANGSGYPGIEMFNKSLSLSHSDFAVANWFAIVVATYNGTPASADTILMRGSTSAFQRLDHSGSTTMRLQSIGEPVAITDVTMAAPSGRFCVALGSRSNGTTGSHWLSSVGQRAGTSAGTPPTGNGGFWVGSRGGTMQFFDGWIHHIVVIDETCHRGGIENAARILRNKWGIDDPDPMPQAASGGTGGFPLSRLVN